MKLLIKTSSNLYMYWNIGSIMMTSMFIQIMIGLFLSMNIFYKSTNLFDNSFFIYFNCNYGWMARFLHSNMTSLIFIMMFIHMTRSLIYKNYLNTKMWTSGMMMMMMLMMVSFMGYSLIWSQMSYWASMVITNFIAIIPIIGNSMMMLIWGNLYIDNILMNRFFSIHFITALLIMMMSIIHLIILHMKKSTNPMNLNNNIDQVNLNSLFIFKDLLLIMVLTYMFLMVNMLVPTKMNNPDNFNQMMMFKTPNHIEPEWYFLFFYSILRSVKNKLAGLMTMMMSIIMWFILPSINKTKFISNKFMMISKMNLLLMMMTLSLITFIGSKTSKLPYSTIMNFLIIIYFMNFMMMIMSTIMINSI